MARNDEPADVELSEEELNKVFSECTIAWAIQEFGLRGLKQRLAELLRRKGVGKKSKTRISLAKLVLRGMDLAREIVKEELVEAEEDAKKEKGKPE